MWNNRFSQPGYLFGTEPAQFLTRHKEWLKPGLSALAVADGEGRNSVYLAGQGLRVTAMDYSDVAIAKAKKLAADKGVSVAFNHADISQWDWVEARFDLVVAVFIQFTGPEARKGVFDGMKRTLKPGGTLMLHGYTPEQIAHGTGGPRAVENLYTLELLQQAFGDFDIRTLNAYETEIDEGAGHSGRSALVDLIATKPA